MKTHFRLTLNANGGEYADESGGFVLYSREHAMETIEALLRGSKNLEIEIKYLEEGYPSLAELKSPPPPETQEGGSLDTISQFA